MFTYDTNNLGRQGKSMDHKIIVYYIISKLKNSVCVLTNNINAPSGLKVQTSDVRILRSTRYDLAIIFCRWYKRHQTWRHVLILSHLILLNQISHLNIILWITCINNVVVGCHPWHLIGPSQPRTHRAIPGISMVIPVV